MKYSLIAVTALATAVAAKPKFLNSNFDVEEGKAFQLKFDGCESTCTIVIQNGASTDLKDVKTVSGTATDGTVDVSFSDLPKDTYAFKITDNTSGEFNYSGQFEAGSGAAATTSAASTSAASTVAASSSAVSSAVSSAASSAASSSAVSTGLTTVTSATPATTVQVTTSAAATPKTTIVTTKSANATFTSGKTGQPTNGAETTPIAVPDSGAARMTSSLALIAGAVAAMFYL